MATACWPCCVPALSPRSSTSPNSCAAGGGSSFGPERVPSFVIHNGVDLSVFTPDGPHERPAERFRLLLVEGSLQGGYETGLETALELAERLAENLPIELVVAGRVSPDLQALYQGRAASPSAGPGWCRTSRSRRLTVPPTCSIPPT